MLRRQFRPAIVMTLVLCVITGLIYPGVVTGLAQLLFPRQANGSLVTVNGRVVGSSLIGQPFTAPYYFHPRPSAAGAGYDDTLSAGTNLGPTSARLADSLIAPRVDSVVREDGAVKGQIPSDMVTASGSGLDPHISPANAFLQVARVARARGADSAAVRELVDRHIEGRQFGILGEPRVNVLLLNIALDSAFPRPAAADTTPAPSALITALRGLTLSGYAEGSYVYSTSANAPTAAAPGTRVITGRLYDRYSDQFMLNALELVLDRPYDATRWDAGVHTRVLFGQNASVIQSHGLDLGAQGDITQLYVTLNIPTTDGNGVQVKVGKMATLMGVEVIEDPANPNWSEGNQFIFVENFTATGVSVEHRFSRRLDVQLRLTNGWDVVQDDNRAKSFMGRVGLYPDTLGAIALIGYWGPEQPGNDGAPRYGGELLLDRKLASALHLWIQGDYGRERANAALPDPTRDAQWWGGGLWATYDVAGAVQLALRGDYVDDRDGARTSGATAFPANTGQRFGSATGTLNLRVWPHALVRPEVRWDRSSIQAFGGRKAQTTFALSAALLF